MPASDTITVTIGEQVFSPISFNSFRGGPFSVTLDVKEGDTPEQAAERASSILWTIARKEYVIARKEFYDRYEGKVQ